VQKYIHLTALFEMFLLNFELFMSRTSHLPYPNTHFVFLAGNDKKVIGREGEWSFLMIVIVVKMVVIIFTS
jgi:hypothetical protein